MPPLARNQKSIPPRACLSVPQGRHERWETAVWRVPRSGQHLRNPRSQQNPLRDALIRLEAEGFVTILPRKGVYINPISLDFIKSAYQIIGSIEADCLNEVFNKLTAYHVRQFEASNERQWELLKNNDYTEYYDENIRFHGIFLSLSENILLEQTLIPLRRRLYDFPRRQYSYEWESMNLYTHQRFIDSVKLGNREAAVSIFRIEHWSYEVHKKYFKLYYDFDQKK